jgi:hypothetical protein
LWGLEPGGKDHQANDQPKATWPGDGGGRGAGGNLLLGHKRILLVK